MGVREEANIESHTTMGAEKYMQSLVTWSQMNTNQKKKQRKRRYSMQKMGKECFHIFLHLDLPRLYSAT